MKTYLEPKDIELMEQSATCERDRLLVRLLFRLGCRVSEVLAIKTSDIDYDAGTITIQHLKKRLRLTCPNCRAQLGRRHRFCPVCGKQVDELVRHQLENRRLRILPIDGNTLDVLKQYLVRTQLITGGGSKLVFGLNRHRAWQIVRDCARRAGLPDLVNPETGTVRGVSPHRLRDAFSVHAMKLDDSGDSLRVLQEHLGHASFNTTARYRKIAGKEHREWYQRLWESAS
jgi:integrase/recombinase XerD